MSNKLKIFCSSLVGTMIGFIFSPIKHSVYIKVCNNGNELKDEQ